MVHIFALVDSPLFRDMSDTISVDLDKFYKLMAAQIVLEVCKQSVLRIKWEEHQANDNSASDSYQCIPGKNKSDSEAYVEDRKHLNIKRW